MKPSPMINVYDWIELEKWLKIEAPTVARELHAEIREREVSNGALTSIEIKDHEDGLCGDTLSPASVAWLKEHVGAYFRVYFWW